MTDNASVNHSRKNDKSAIKIDDNKKMILLEKRFAAIKKFRRSIIRFSQQNNELKKWLIFEMKMCLI